MKLTKSQEQFIKNVIETEKELDQTLWLQWIDNKWAMGTHEDISTYFHVNGKLVKSLTDKNILINKDFTNQWGSTLQGMSLNDEYRVLAI
jgi:hypothetical protein